VPPSKKMMHDEALAELTKRYFMSHGPATLQDFVWWSGLKTTDARAGIEMIGSTFVSETVAGQVYWFSPTLKTIKEKSSAHLLPNFDEYTVAYKDRNLLIDTTKVKEMLGPFTLLGNVIVVDGRVAGTWKRTLKKDKVEIAISHLHVRCNTNIQLLKKAAEHYGKFHALPASVKINL
jgi:hypothetical protein